MAGGFGALGASFGAKLLVAAAIAATAVSVTGLPARETAPASRSVATPASTPRRPAQQAVATPAAAPADDGLVVKRILNIDGPLEHGAWVWDDQGVPAGPIIITIDLAAQTLSVFRGGYEIGVAVILYGADDKQSPLGVFPITEKDSDHVSNIYKGAPMPYMLRLTNDGVAIHGSDVEWGAATHGCIGVPVKFAALLFSQANLGDRVIITNGKMLGLGERI